MSRPDAPPARMPGARLLPSQALIDEGDPPADLPVCDHYCGVEDRMLKSLQLQAELGPVFDVTLDNEDGAPVGGELDQAQLISADCWAVPTTASAASACGCCRWTTRVLPTSPASCCAAPVPPPT
jgi:hypothetical protein